LDEEKELTQTEAEGSEGKLVLNINRTIHAHGRAWGFLTIHVQAKFSGGVSRVQNRQKLPKIT